MKRNYIGFTLVELVVTMTVVAILGTIATVYVFDSLWKSRDSARVTSINQIIQNMDLFKVDAGRYPEPDNIVVVTHSGAELWKQGEFWPSASQSLGVYGSDYPQDPLYEHNYTYSVTNNNTEYQIWGIIEDTKDALEEELTSLIVPQANAAVTTAYLRWNYNWFLARTLSSGTTNFIVTPSIIASDLSSPDIIDIIDNERLVFDEFFNLPSTYQNSVDTFGWFFFFPDKPLIYSWALSGLQNRETLTEFINEVKFTYASSQISAFPKYQDMIEWDTYTSTKKILESVFGVPFSAHSCNDILANGEWLADWFYVVDSDEGEDGSVYCDMTTWDGWWTRVWVDYITNGEFQDGNDIESEWDSKPSNNIVNLGADNTPVTSPYALHQTSNSWWTNTEKSESHYNIHFDDADMDTVWYQFPTSLLQPGYEIRMTAWVRDDDNSLSWLSCETDACKTNPSQWYIFHNRLFYNDGTNDVNGVVEILDTQTTPDGNQWELQRVRRTIRKTPNEFDWYMWHGAELNTDLYITGVKLEIYYK